MSRCTPSAIAGLLLFAACPVSGSQAEDPPPIVVADFEQPSDRSVVETRKGAVISSEISSRGRSSLKIEA
ncbi:MAG: hypothetical protein ABIF82_08345, partial [Planctomycetota bacterium]